MDVGAVQDAMDRLLPISNLREIEFKKNQYGPQSESIALRYERGLFLPVAGATFNQAARDQQVEDVS
jgi:hypothetical protein